MKFNQVKFLKAQLSVARATLLVTNEFSKKIWAVTFRLSLYLNLYLNLYAIIFKEN